MSESELQILIRAAFANVRDAEHTDPVVGENDAADELGTAIWENASAGGNPGDGKMIFGSTIQPGWLLCDGSAVSKTTYADLFAVIGFSQGGGDPGGGNFNLPDMQQKFPMGKSGAESLGDIGGDFDHTHTSAAHTHTLGNEGGVAIRQLSATRVVYSTIGGPPAFNYNDAVDGSSVSTSGSASATKLVGTTTSRTPGATGTNNPPFLVVNYIIKT